MAKLTTIMALTLIACAAPAWAQTTTEPSTDGTNNQTIPEVMTPPAPGTDGTTATTGSTTGQTAANNWYTLQQGDLRASRLIGMSVTNAAGEAIGDINEIVLQQDGKVGAIVVGVGGFLGMGEREVAIPFSSLKMVADSNGSTNVTVDATRDSLTGAPAWQWSN